MSQVEPLFIEETLKDEFWIMSMHEELNQFKRNDVCELVAYSKNMDNIDTKWVFKNKLVEHGLITRNKAKLVDVYPRNKPSSTFGPNLSSDSFPLFNIKHLHPNTLRCDIFGFLPL